VAYLHTTHLQFIAIALKAEMRSEVVPPGLIDHSEFPKCSAVPDS
jgi:hypothetical protein